MVYSCKLNPPKISGITKSYTSEAGVPALQLLFVVIAVMQEGMIGEDTNDQDMGKLVFFSWTAKERES